MLVILLFTDYGWDGFYLGQVEMALTQRAPGVRVINLMADAPAFAPRPAGHLLAALGPGIPSGAVVLGVVDPGVGSERGAVVVKADERWFVGPDNGLFGPLAARAEGVEAWSITWRPERLSASFHGRDLFAPVAAAVHGRDYSGLEFLPVERMVGASDGGDLGEVIYIDGYGNAMTGLRGDGVPAGARIALGSEVVAGARTFSDVPEGEAFWYINSIGLVEVAVNQGRADRRLGVSVGTPVIIHGNS